MTKLAVGGQGVPEIDGVSRGYAYASKIERRNNDGNAKSATRL